MLRNLPNRLWIKSVYIVGNIHLILKFESDIYRIKLHLLNLQKYS